MSLMDMVVTHTSLLFQHHAFNLTSSPLSPSIADYSQDLLFGLENTSHCELLRSSLCRTYSDPRRLRKTCFSKQRSPCLLSTVPVVKKSTSMTVPTFSKDNTNLVSLFPQYILSLYKLPCQSLSHTIWSMYLHEPMAMRRDVSQQRIHWETSTLSEWVTRYYSWKPAMTCL